MVTKLGPLCKVKLKNNVDKGVAEKAGVGGSNPPPATMTTGGGALSWISSTLTSPPEPIYLGLTTTPMLCNVFIVNELFLDKFHREQTSAGCARRVLKVLGMRPDSYAVLISTFC